MAYKCYVCPTPYDLEDYYKMADKLKQKHLNGWSPELPDCDKQTLVNLKNSLAGCNKLQQHTSCDTEYGCFLILAESKKYLLFFIIAPLKYYVINGAVL